MRLLIKIIVMTTALCFCLPSAAQPQQDNANHATNDMHDHEDHDREEANSSHAANSGHGASDGPVLTRTEDIESALADGGEPIVADVLGVVCDFCALAMNKIFSKREEVAAIYVDLDTKALNLVLVPGASMSDQTITDLAVQAGYRIAEVRRGDAALGGAS